MSRFYGKMDAGRKPRTVRGFATRGITAHINGSQIGGRIDISIKPSDETVDQVEFFSTCGSYGDGAEHLIGTLTRAPDGKLLLTMNPRLADHVHVVRGS